jgi:dTDP-4-amino-4,6-dideoxygalactose transaminase
MDSIFINAKPTIDALNVEVDTKKLSEELSRQGILDDSVPNREADFFYLASLALETKDDDYTMTEALMEFIECAPTYEHLDKEECQRIEALLEGDIVVSDDMSA